MAISKFLRPKVNFRIILLAIGAYLLLASALVIFAANQLDSTDGSKCSPSAQLEAPMASPESDSAHTPDCALPVIEMPVPPYDIVEDYE